MEQVEAASSRQPSVLIVEDERLVAVDLAQQLESMGYQVVGVASSAAEATKVVNKSVPDIAVMDIVLADGSDGIDLAVYLRDTYHTPTVFITAFADQATVDRAKRAHPSGFLVKPYDQRELHAALQIALFQRTPWHNRLVDTLSRRERQVLNFFLDGLQTCTIAKHLNVSAQTIRNHLKNVSKKLEVHSQAELRELFASRQGKPNASATR